MGNRSQREILIENQIYLAGLDKDSFVIKLSNGELDHREFIEGRDSRTARSTS